MKKNFEMLKIGHILTSQTVRFHKLIKIFVRPTWICKLTDAEKLLSKLGLLTKSMNDAERSRISESKDVKS